MSIPRVLRVGLDGRPLQPGFREDSARGIGVYARELLRSLAARHDLALTLWFEPALRVPDGLVPPGVRVQRYPGTPLPMRDRLSSQLAVAQVASSRKHDVFHWFAHVHAPVAPPKHGVITVHDLILEQFAELYPQHRTAGYRTARKLEAMAVRNARTLVADSQATADDVMARHGVPRERIQVAPLGVDPHFAPVSAAEVAGICKHHQFDAPFVLYVGGIDARKDVPMLLDAFARVKKKRKAPLLLVLAGHVKKAPEFPEIEARAKHLGLGDSLRILDFVPDEHLPRLLSAARVFAFPSRAEGFGLPPLEAMACGTPVVSTVGGSLGEVLGDAALTVAPGDPKAFARALQRALDQETLRANLRAKGLARAASFTWKRTAESTVAAYRLAAERGLSR